MKSRGRFFGLLVAGGSAFAVWLLFISPADTPNPNGPSPSNRSPADLASAGTERRAPGNEGLLARIYKRAELKARIEAAYDTPFPFYGRVVDEGGNPVEGAEATLSFADRSPEGTTQVTQVTDADGMFRVEGMRAKSVFVRVRKAGYHDREDLNRRGFDVVDGWSPDFLRPDSNQPVVFVLQKALEAERLIKWDKNADFGQANAVIGYDLSTGQKSRTTPDIVLKYAADRTGRGLPLYNWQLSIEVPNGGIVERKSKYDFIAPEEGYRSVAQLRMDAKAARYQWSQDQDYFVQARGGTMYARLHIKAVAGDRPFAIVIAYVNPGGSRILEYDPDLGLAPLR